MEEKKLAHVILVYDDGSVHTAPIVNGLVGEFVYTTKVEITQSREPVGGWAAWKERNLHEQANQATAPDPQPPGS